MGTAVCFILAKYLNLTFRQLANPDMYGNYSITEFAQGFVHGVQKYENETSRCATDVAKVQDIINGLVALWKKIQSGAINPAEIVAFFYNSWATLNIIESSCHFYAFVQDLISLATNPLALIIRIVHVLFIGIWTIVPSWLKMVYYAIVGESYWSGVNLGRILKAIFEYEIE